MFFVKNELQDKVSDRPVNHPNKGSTAKIPSRPLLPGHYFKRPECFIGPGSSDPAYRYRVRRWITASLSTPLHMTPVNKTVFLGTSVTLVGESRKSNALIESTGVVVFYRLIVTTLLDTFKAFSRSFTDTEIVEQGEILW
ncbi:hypothetical protein ARMGADRAFT_1038256 [Armillaria gallica]|uniref:Uncharacterized protein n=1 Tax=Armillaria gallica TaxID=47427 RepID=A0A2H3CWX5_ARMGA|nr:hypothetical protein ARMGADRAFT_1038256 [Armillaria gallica]